MCSVVLAIRGDGDWWRERSRWGFRGGFLDRRAGSLDELEVERGGQAIGGAWIVGSADGDSALAVYETADHSRVNIRGFGESMGRKAPCENQGPQLFTKGWG